MLNMTIFQLWGTPHLSVSFLHPGKAPLWPLSRCPRLHRIKSLQEPLGVCLPPRACSVPFPAHVTPLGPRDEQGQLFAGDVDMVCDVVSRSVSVCRKPPVVWERQGWGLEGMGPRPELSVSFQPEFQTQTWPPRLL